MAKGIGDSRIVCYISEQVSDTEPTAGELEEWGIVGFRDLSPERQLILLKHMRHPEMTREQLAEACNVHIRTVFRFFASEAYDQINRTFADHAVRKLRVLSVKALEQCLKGKNEAVKASVARAILASDGLLRDAPKEVVQKQEISVAWGKTPIDVTPRPKLENGAEATSKH